jgi:hypothetical protein
MFEEKWWTPKPIGQLEKEEKARQFEKWVKDKCNDIVAYVSGGNSEYYWHREEDGIMKICYTTKERYENCSLSTECEVAINDFWDKDDPKCMAIVVQ